MSNPIIHQGEENAQMHLEFYVVRKEYAHEVLVDRIDADLMERHWFILVPPKAHTAYVQRMVYTPSRYNEKLHILIMERIIGRLLVKGEMVDHKNRNGLDNRRENLRLATSTQNAANRKIDSRNAVGLKGVYQRDGKFRAQIQVNKQKVMLGTFDTPELAHEAYKQAAIKYFGEFARFE